MSEFTFFLLFHCSMWLLPIVSRVEISSPSIVTPTPIATCLISSAIDASVVVDPDSGIFWSALSEVSSVEHC